MKPEEICVLETAQLDVRPQLTQDFEQAQAIISSMPGYVRHELRRCLEKPNRYVLLVWWERLEDHTEGFRQSEEYQEWKTRLHHFYDPFPEVEHYSLVVFPAP